MKERIKTIIAQVFDACRSEGMFTGELPDFVVESPRSREHGDLAVNVAMMLAKSEKKPPREIAQSLVARLQGCDPVIEKLEIAGPGFINFYLRQDAWHEVLKDIEDQGSRFGSCRVGKGRRVMVEFVSANPTGPLHIGHGRGAALGDALARVLAFAGFDVVREYYINDIGNQMQNLGRSLYLRYQQLLKKDVEFPEETSLPAIYNALKVAGPNGQVILEVVKHLDATKVKAISMHSTDGLQRGIEVEDMEEQITVPVGPEVFGEHF